MFTAISHISLFAVIVATAASFILGGLWFAVIMAKPYLVAMGKEKAPKSKPSPLFVFGPAVCNFVIIITSAILITMLGIHEMTDALMFGALVAIGYLIPMCMMIAIYPNFPRPFFYTAINAPYFIATSLLSSAIIVLIK